MKQFKFVARRKDGSLTDGWISADSEQQARRMLADQQRQVVMLSPYKAKSNKKVSREALITTLRELATLRESGMALDLCMASLYENTEDDVLKVALKRLHYDVESGSSLSDAIAAQPEVFPFYAASMLKLGEASGKLGEALFNISERIEREEQLITEVKSALTYPAFLLIVCVVVLFFMFMYVIPNFETMVQDAKDAGMLGKLLSVSRFLNDNITIISAGLVALAGGLYYGFRYGSLLQSLIQGLSAIPMFRELVDAWNIVQFSGSMQRLLESGVELVESVEITRNGISDETLRKRLGYVVTGVREGKGLADSLGEFDLFPAMVRRLIKTGEAGASLVPCFREINNLYERRLSKGLKRFLSILEPLVIVVMGGIVGSIMIILISGIISVNDINF
ncbi:Putative type II secretion system protein F [Vibrio aerogenes CECT 7868]|uniref:Putative type II secretion system protein F n=1 Tax=Vibrio aerogenes CECT 7868 TaxID=1216006 RepID=A0A1M5ZCP0_9VIBR|nr:type II secretion system F family protein [Vibrio aerogenes]SHI21971.1 Putative type II secretion system protein F [Vibrio aerogenes CECT 7868]